MGESPLRDFIDKFPMGKRKITPDTVAQKVAEKLSQIGRGKISVEKVILKPGQTFEQISYNEKDGTPSGGTKIAVAKETLEARQFVDEKGNPIGNFFRYYSSRQLREMDREREEKMGKSK